MKTATLAELFPGHVSGYWGKDEGTGDVDALVVRNSDVLVSGAVRWAEVPRRAISSKELTKAEVRAGDLLLTTSGDCGRVAHVEAIPQPTIASNFVRLLRPDPSRADPRFLWHQMRTERFRAALQPFIRGTTIDNLAVGPSFESVQLVLPPIEEQRRIAAILDAADELGAKRRAALAKLETVTQAVFIDRFGDPSAGGTPLVPLEKLVGAPITRGIDQPGPDVEHGVPYLKTTDFRGSSPLRKELARSAPEVAARFPRSVVGAGDSVICIRATVGPTLFITEELDGVNLSRGTARVSPSNDVLPKFLFTAISSAHFQRQIRARLRGATFLQIPLKELKQLEIQLPSMSEQRKLVDAVGAVDSQVAATRRNLASLDDLFASLRQRAFRGEL